MGTMAGSTEGRSSPRGNAGMPDMSRQPRALADTPQGEHYQVTDDGSTSRGLSAFLGLFSVGLGMAQLVSPGSVARLCGIADDDQNRSAMRALGLRELTSGVGILSQPHRPEWVWSRVAGDMMDLALLGRVLTHDENERQRTSAATAAVLGVTALDFVVARRLQQEHQRRGEERVPRTMATPAQQKAAVRAIHTKMSVTVNKPVEEVYAFWRDFENLPRFMRHLESVRVLDERRSHWVAKAPAGATVEWDAEITEEEPDRRLAWRSLEGADVYNAGAVEFTPAPQAGTEVRVELRYSPPGGVLASKLAMLFREEPGQQVQDDLRHFKQVLETGEIVYSDATYNRGMHPAQPLREEEL